MLIYYLLFCALIIGIGIALERLNDKAIQDQRENVVIELISVTYIPDKKLLFDEAQFAVLERPIECFWSDVDFINKLKQVKIALASNNYEAINDELIRYSDVTKPILLVKQYQKDNVWYNVPAYCYITDHHALLKWLKQSPVHPSNSDTIKDPNPYNDMPTQYVWHDLTQHFIPPIDAPNNLTDLCNQLGNMALQKSSQPKVSHFPQSLFGTNKTHPDEPKSTPQDPEPSRDSLFNCN